MPSVTNVPLKYLFIVTYKDGTQLAQNEEDISRKDPKRSSFYDVDIDNVNTFVLYEHENTYEVDLETGVFCTTMDFGGPAEFTVGDPGPKPYKLIFYRQHTHNFNVGLDELSHLVKYCIGYTDGNGIDHKIYVD